MNNRKDYRMYSIRFQSDNLCTCKYNFRTKKKFSDHNKLTTLSMI